MEFPPMHIGLRSTLSLVMNKPMSESTISAIMKLSKSTTSDRMDKLLAMKYVRLEGKLYHATELGEQAAIHSPIRGHHTGAYIQASKGKTSQVEHKPYTCPELGRNPGLPDERFEAFDKPSRMGDKLHYRDGRIEDYPHQVG